MLRSSEEGVLNVILSVALVAGNYLNTGCNQVWRGEMPGRQRDFINLLIIYSRQCW